MRRPFRFLAAAAVLAGGLMVMKGMEFAFGVSEAWAGFTQDAEDDASPGSGSQSGDGPLLEAEERYLPRLAAERQACPVVEAPQPENDARFARRVGASPSEIEVLRSLAQRRGALDEREASVRTRESLLAAAETRVEQRIADLRELRDDIEAMIGALNEAEETEVQRLVSVYGNMEPRAAAPAFAALEERYQIQIAARMPARTLAELMAEMAPREAARLTQLLATRHALPQTVAELEARLGSDG